MFYLQAIITLICAVGMFIAKRESKFILFLVSFLCMNLFTLNVGPYSSLKVLLILSYCLSEYRIILSSFSSYKLQRIFWPVVLMICPCVVLFIHSPHYPGFGGFVKIIVNEFLLQYIMLWVGFSIYSEHYSFSRIYKVLYYCVIIITIFAIINIVLHSTPWVSFFGNKNYDDAVYAARERFNVKSIFFQNFMYGFMCIISISLAYYGYMKCWLKTNRWYLILAMCILGILVCGSRTVWLSSLIFAVFTFLSNGNIKAIKYGILGILCVCIAYVFVPAVTSRVDMFLDTFNENNEISGSSLSMREMQFDAVLSYINNDPIFGRGYKFFYYDLGWGQFYSGGRVDADLRGIEGVYLSYLLERGWFGYLSYLMFYFYLVFILLKSDIDKLPKFMAMAIVFSYVAFAHMTGDLGTAPIALFFVGTFIKLGEIDNFRKKEEFYD